MKYINKKYMEGLIKQTYRLKNLPQDTHNRIWKSLDEKYWESKANNEDDIVCDTPLWVSKNLTTIMRNMNLLK